MPQLKVVGKGVASLNLSMPSPLGHLELAIPMIQYLLGFPVFGISLTASVLTTRWLRNAAIQRGWCDQPDERRIHKTPIPRIGGIGIAAGFFSGILFFGLLSSVAHGLDYII